MKRNLWFYLLILLVLTVLTFCVKKEEPVAKTTNNEESGKKGESADSLANNLSNLAITEITPETARDVIVNIDVNIEMINNGSQPNVYPGVCWNTSKNPTTDNSKSEWSWQSSFKKWNTFIEGLERSTTYYFRAYVIIEGVGTGYSNEVSFTTPASSPPIAFNPDFTYGSVNDVDGNTYRTIQIGAQTWMAENLKTTKYSDGSPILFGTGGPAGYTDWFDAGDGNYRYYDGAYCWYNDDASTYKDIFGAIYNWHAVGTGKLCPTGWHVPTISDWTILINTLGGQVEDFNERSENAMINCSDNSINESGFTPVDAGELCGWGFLRSNFWWSATPRDTGRKVPYAYLISFHIYGFEPQSYGYSVRCLKN